MMLDAYHDANCVEMDDRCSCGLDEHLDAAHDAGVPFTVAVEDWTYRPPRAGNGQGYSCGIATSPHADDDVGF